MAIRGEHRVKKLESALLAELTPTERVRMVLTAAAAGDKDQARRIGQACPMETYRMPDADYLDHLEHRYALCKAAVAHFWQYVSALRHMAHVKDLLCGDVVGVIASHACTLFVSAMLKGGETDRVDWAKVDAAEEEARQFAASVTARTLDAMQGGIRRHALAEWAGFHTACRQELGLDAWTLLKGCEMPQELIAEVEELLRPEADQAAQAPDRPAVEESLAFWQGTIQSAREEQHDRAASRG